MTNNPRFGCKEYFLQAYENAQSDYGQLELDYDDYVNCLLPIITKYLGDPPQEFLIIKFLSELHTNDLYLTIACAQKSEMAWQQFETLFREHIFHLAKRESANVDAARELISKDRKSTRLNSSHLVISYAVFCLKKQQTCSTS